MGTEWHRTAIRKDVVEQIGKRLNVRNGYNRTIKTATDRPLLARDFTDSQLPAAVVTMGDDTEQLPTSFGGGVAKNRNFRTVQFMVDIYARYSGRDVLDESELYLQDMVKFLIQGNSTLLPTVAAFSSHPGVLGPIIGDLMHADYFAVEREDVISMRVTFTMGYPFTRAVL